MRLPGYLALLSILSFVSGCETGWDLRGRVVTDSVPDKMRPLRVLMVTAPTLDPANLPTGQGWYKLLAEATTIPERELPFDYSALGCHAGDVVIVAWSPKTLPAGNDAAHGDAIAFEPGQGDLIATSDVRRPHCGSKTDAEDITVVLKE